jgi:hypothetical protein
MIDLSHRTRVDPSGCWIWTGTKTAAGYGQMMRAGRKLYTHRIAFENVNGPIPAGLLVRHTCDTPACINPAHLLVGTQTDNMGDAAERGRVHSRMRGVTHCVNGHDFTDENTWTDARGWRHCRACARVRAMHTYYRKRGKHIPQLSELVPASRPAGNRRAAK